METRAGTLSNNNSVSVFFFAIKFMLDSKSEIKIIPNQREMRQKKTMTMLMTGDLEEKGESSSFPSTD